VLRKLAVLFKEGYGFPLVDTVIDINADIKHECWFSLHVF